MLGSVFSAVLVALLWGVTNPLMKRGGQGIDKIQRSNFFLQFLAELKHLFLNWQYLLPFILNQSGSVLFYVTLATSELSLVVPVTNSLTFLFTTVTGSLLGEDIGGKGYL
ncbi:hypothetical protein BSL78_07122 [Apostichopus japonicus]|uniref:Transmembrane protein n=1 Tax=Stichopus japonicus TaxID=307972 RepID=A0A2G8L6U4_STIJA|nr:hypothetical protein BSL78_07122 [Apostichopus japonicus]